MTVKQQACMMWLHFICQNKTGLLNFVGERIKHVYSINFIGTVWKQSALFKNSKKTQFIMRHTPELKSISKISIINTYFVDLWKICDFFFILQFKADACLIFLLLKCIINIVSPNNGVFPKQNSSSTLISFLSTYMYLSK